MLVRSYCPIWYLPDLTGNPLNDQYYIFILENDLPYIPATVWQDANGISPWANPIQFFPNGTLPDNIYWAPDVVYRLEIRMGNTQNDPLIYLIENYVPSGSGGVSPSGSDFSNSQNLVIDPNFSDISFSSPVTFAMAGTYNIAPNWQLILTGSGSTTLKQQMLPGSNNLPGNPPYSLEINNSGWTEAQLVQTFSNNGALFANGSVSMSVLAKTVTNPYAMTLNYVANGSALSPPVAQGTTAVGVYTTISGVANIGPSSNAAVGMAANVQMTISLPTADIIYITNVQFIGQESPVTVFTAPPYQELSYPQIVNDEFYYYNPLLQYKPVPSYLTGWDFALNPTQFYGSTVTPKTFSGTNKSRYVWDQTILFQAIDNTLNTSRNTNTGGLGITNNGGAATGSRLAIIQYLADDSIFDILTQRTSIQLKGALTQGAGTVSGTISLYWTANTGPNVPQLPASVVASIGAGGVPAVSSGWTAVPNTNYGINVPFTFTTTDLVFNFSGFDPTANYTPSSTSTAVAVIIAFDTLAHNSEITIDYCSLVGGDIPTRPAPLSFDETLRKCQFYYEKSYDAGTNPGATTSNSELIFQQNAATLAGSTVFWPNSFSINYKNVKLIAPTAVNLYSPATGTVANISATAKANAYASSTTADYAISNFTADISGLNTATYIPNSGISHGPTAATTTLPQVGYIEVQYTVNATLGADPLLP